MNKTKVFSLIRLVKYTFKKYKFHVFAIFIFILLSTYCMVRGTMLIQVLIDKFIIPNINNKSVDFQPLKEIIKTMILTYLTGIICTLIYQQIIIRMAQGTLKNLRDDVFEHMEGLPIKYFDTHAHGDIMSVYSSDIDVLRDMLAESLPQVISALFTTVGVIVSMIILSLPLTILVLLMIAIILLTTKYLSTKSGQNFSKQQSHIGRLNGYVEEMLEGLKVVKVFSYENEISKKFSELNYDLFKASNNAYKYANILGPAVGNLGNINFVLTTVVGSILAIFGVGGFTIGKLISFLQFTRTLNGPVAQITQQINTIIRAGAGTERIFAILDEKKEENLGYVTLVNIKIDETGKIYETKEKTGNWAWKHPHTDGSVTYERLLGNVVFENVYFGYNKDKNILHNINLYAKPGEKIAFVGATGAGKTTITNLINKFYDIQAGKIRYDGINIDKINKNDLRASLGIVLQDTHLFSGTIADNIRYGNLDATDEEVVEAAKLANADYFINHLSNGYNTYLKNAGNELSQGQKQLLAIARAAIANPPVLILDEATSSIDTRTEKIVQEGMDKLMKGRTVFVIAHRLSTIKNSDVIMVLDQGKIIERGNHDELIAQKGNYYQLYTGGFENQ